MTSTFNMDSQNSSNENSLDEPKERPRTAAELAAIQAAMMEELGVGRKDTLPLEDRGYSEHLRVTKPPLAKKPVNERVARWQNLEFDDVDEATAQLDNIADGQLYRLRRDDSSGSHTASRPRHNSLLARGARATNSSGASRRGAFANTGHQTSPGTIQGFYNDARRGVNTGQYASSSIIPSKSIEGNRRGAHNRHSSLLSMRGVNRDAHVEKTIATLMAKPQDTPLSNPTTAPAPSNLALSRYSGCLASADEFMTAMGLNARPGNLQASSASDLQSKVTPPSSTSAESHISSLAITPDTGTVDQLTFPMPRPTVADLSKLGIVPEILQMTCASTPPTNRSTGLASSRWADPRTNGDSLARSSLSTMSGSDNSPAPVASPALNISTPSSDMAAPATSVVNPPVPGPSAVSAPVNTSGKATTSSTPGTLPVSSCLALKGSGNANNSAATTSSTTFLSSQNILIENVVEASKNGNLGVIMKAKLMKDLVLVLMMGNENVLVQNMADKASFSCRASIITIYADPNVYALKFQSPQEASTFAQLLTTQLKIVESPSKQEAVLLASSSTLGTALGSVRPNLNASSLMDSSLVYGSDIGDAKTVPPDLSTARNVQALVDDSQLIDFSDESSEVSPQPQNSSALDDLACMNNDPLVESALKVLNNAFNGSFLAANLRLSEEALSSMAEALVLAYLKKSSVFKSLPNEVANAFAKEISSQVIELAHTDAVDSKPTVFRPSLFISENSHPQLVSGSQQVNEGLESETTEAGLSVADNDSSGVNKPQLKYSVKELLSLRMQDLHMTKSQMSRIEELKLLPRRTVRHLRNQSLSESIHSRQKVSKPMTSKVAGGSSTTQTPQPLSQLTSEQASNSGGRCNKTDPTLYGSLLSAIIPMNAHQEPTCQHHPTHSDVNVRLSQSFHGLAVSHSTLNAGQADPLSKSTKDVGPAVSAEFQTTPSQSTSTVGSAVPIPLSTSRNIFEISNKKEDMAKAKVRGLSWSKWSTNIPPTVSSAISFPSSQTSQTLQYRTGLLQDVNNLSRYHPATDLEVLDTTPVMAHQLVSPLRPKENIPFSSITSFPSRPNTLDHSLSNTSNPSNYKADVPSFKFSPPSAPNSSRTPLSSFHHGSLSQASIQERLNRSLAERYG